MSLVRQVPITFDPPRQYHNSGDPFHTYRDAFRDFFRDQGRDPFRDHGRDPFRDQGRDPFRDYVSVREPFREYPPLSLREAHSDRDYRNVYHEPAYQTALQLQPVQPSVPALPLSRSFFNSERQLGHMDQEMARMAADMKKMFTDVQQLMPVDANPDSWRIKENFHLENPVISDANGSRLCRLKFDVRQFRPEEIQVKTVGNQLTVHAKHEDKTEGKSLHREYHRQYLLPKDINGESLTSKLSRDGILTIEAPIPVKGGHRDHMIPIKHE